MEDQLCTCGCGRAPVKGARYAKGHRPKPELKPCACGCGELVKGQWVHGHYARVNNPSSTPEVKVKRSISAKRRIAEGERSFAGWNRGLTVETDARVAAYGDKISAKIDQTPGRREQMSESCKKQWDEGRIRTARGPEHGRWKGGVSGLHQRCRASLYHYWARPIMVRDSFTCQRCRDAKGGNLVVHHDQERFAAILQKVVGGRDVSTMTFEEQGDLVEAVVNYHLARQTSGTTLCRDCHRAVHAIDPDTDLD